MSYTSVEVHGFRGFANTQKLHLAVPDGKPGSGLTTIVGPNNAGKSTITEALRALGHRDATSFTEGRRNKNANDRVRLAICADDGRTKVLETVASGGSETEIRWSPDSNHELRIFSLSSRRQFNPYFGKGVWSRKTYLDQDSLPTSRGAGVERSSNRLFEIQKNRTKFDAVLKRIISPVPDWKIEQSDSGQYYLKFLAGDLAHSSEGMGEGLVSLFLIVDALYDSKAGDTIAIDEPELSLHPAFQRKLAQVFREFSANRQIVCATHSPHFVDFNAIASGGQIARVVRDSEGSKIAQLGAKSSQLISAFLRDLNNPHILGLDAREVFFLEDKIVLVEGQEDAVIYPKIADQLNLKIAGDFYGWGIGGAGNMEMFATILSELGFKKVFGLLDGNRADQLKGLQEKFSRYVFACIPADDVRSKDAIPSRPAVEGIADSKGLLKLEFVNATRAVLEGVNTYFNN